MKPCICESGLEASTCCLKSNDDWYKRPANCIPNGDITGYAHPKCYASCLNDCSLNISKEHLFTHAILKQQSHDGVSSVSGIKGQSKAIASIPHKRLVAKVLCERHNNALSPLDQEGARLYRVLLRFAMEWEQNPANANSEAIIFNGEDIERFMVKTASAMIISGNATNLQLNPDFSVPQDWVNMLFGKTQWIPDLGMRLILPINQQMEYNGGYGINVSLADQSNQNTFGINMLIGGFEFLLPNYLRAIPFGSENGKIVFPDYHVRPNSINFQTQQTCKSILFSWDDCKEHKDIFFTWDGINRSTI